MQNLVVPTVVAMATTFALGAESKRLPACTVTGEIVADCRRTSVQLNSPVMLMNTCYLD